MRTLLLVAVAAAAMSAATVGAAQAQNNCPVTETTSTGPNGETIIRREACGAVEIISTTPPTTTSTTTSTTRTRTNNTPPANRPSNTPPANTGGGSNAPPSTPTSVMTIPNRNIGSNNNAPSSMPPGGVGGGFNPVNVPDPMAMQRPVARIVLYDNSTFRGRNIGITQNTPNLERRRFSEIASAARSQGGVWELCTEPNYGGTCVTTDSDLDLASAGVDNTIASVRLVRP